MTTPTEIAFDKYARKGAYHWRDLEGPLHRRNAYTQARYGAVIRALADSALPKGARVLDVGCGDGALAGLLARRFAAEIVGVDTTPLSIEMSRTEFAKRDLAGTFLVVDGYRYPFEDGAFAAVVCSDVIEHVREPEAMLAEMRRLTAPGGVVVVTTPVRYTEAPLDPMHVQEWFPGDFKVLCSTGLGTPVELHLSHPVALSELYALPTMLGRIVRLTCNGLSALGRNPFASRGAFRACSTQTVVARIPAHR